MTMSNKGKAELIISALEVLHKKEKQERNVFKARAYAKVISAVKDFPRPINSMEDVEQIDGVGERIREKIKEIIETGHLEAADKIQQDKGVDAADAFLKIYGVGPAKAKELVAAGIRSIAELRAAVEKGSVSLNDKQQIGLKYYDDILQRIPRDEVAEHEAVITNAFHAVNPAFECQIVGSYRRGAADSGDVDVLVKATKVVAGQFQLAIQRLRESGYLMETLAEGEKKYMGLGKVKGVARRIDILLTPEAEYAFAVLYFTGSDKFNVAMRKHALTLGWSLNEHGLTATAEDKRPPTNLLTEEAIFKFLGVPWVPPTERSQFPKIT